jgi:hypothetical protein
MGKVVGAERKIAVSLKMQAKELLRKFTVLLLVFTLPLAFWVSVYYTAGDEPTPITVPTLDGDVVKLVPARESYPIDLGLMAVAWSMATVAFFAESGGAERDRRLVLCGYASWQILLARLILLAGVAFLTSTIPLALFAPVLSPKHPWVLWLALLSTGLIALMTGLLVGALVPRYTEGVLTIISLYGIGMSLQGDVAKLFITYPARQLFRSGLYADKPLVLPFVTDELLAFAILLIATIASWFFRVEVRARALLKLKERAARER